MITNRPLVVIVASLFLMFLMFVLFATLKLSFSAQKSSFFESAGTIFEIEAFKKAYEEQSKNEKIIQIVESRALKPMLSYQKSSETIGEYKIDGADPAIGWDFVKDIMSKGFRIEELVIEQRQDHRVDLYLKVQF